MGVWAENLDQLERRSRSLKMSSQVYWGRIVAVREARNWRGVSWLGEMRTNWVLYSLARGNDQVGRRPVLQERTCVLVYRRKGREVPCHKALGKQILQTRRAYLQKPRTETG